MQAWALMMPIVLQSAPGIRNSCIGRLRTCGEFLSFWNISNQHWKNSIVLPLDHQNGTTYLIYTLSTMFCVYSTVSQSKWHGSLFVSSSSKANICKLSTQLWCLKCTNKPTLLLTEIYQLWIGMCTGHLDLDLINIPNPTLMSFAKKKSLCKIISTD